MSTERSGERASGTRGCKTRSRALMMDASVAWAPVRGARQCDAKSNMDQITRKQTLRCYKAFCAGSALCTRHIATHLSWTPPGDAPYPYFVSVVLRGMEKRGKRGGRCGPTDVHRRGLYAARFWRASLLASDQRARLVRFPRVNAPSPLLSPRPVGSPLTHPTGTASSVNTFIQVQGIKASRQVSHLLNRVSPRFFPRSILRINHALSGGGRDFMLVHPDCTVGAYMCSALWWTMADGV